MFVGVAVGARRSALNVAACVVATMLCIALSFAQTPLQALADTGAATQESQQTVCVRGVDTFSISGDAFECATVAGLGGNTLYADVLVDGKVAAQDLAYAYDSAQDTFGVMQLNKNAAYIAAHSGAVALNFYAAASADREGNAALLSENVYAVCLSVAGQPVGSVAESMIGIRCAKPSEAELAIDAPTQIVRGDKTYVLSSNGKAKPTLKDGVLYVSYNAVDSEQSVSAAVVYTDEQGSVLQRDTYSIAKGGSVNVDVRTSIELDGRVYTPAAVTSKVTLSAESPEQRIYCMEQAKADTSTQDVSISYVSTNGSSLMSDRVSVGAGGYLYAPATAFSRAGDSSVVRYVLTGASDSLGNAYTADEAKSLKLTRDGAREYTLVYAPEENELTYTVNFALVSNAGNGNTGVSVQKSESAKVSSTQDAVVVLPESIEQDGVSYARFGDDESLTYTWSDVSAGRALSDTVYYVAADVVAPQPYEVNVRYVDAVSGAELGGETLTCNPDAGALSISSPETVTADGVTYERLSGQDDAISHKFYDPYRTYTVYYAQPGAMGQGDTVVYRTEVVDGGVRYYTIAQDGTVSAAGESSAGGLTTNTPYVVVAGSNAVDASDAGSNSVEAGEVVAPNGNSAYSERIDDDETPLASASDVSSDDQGFNWAAGAGLAVVAAIAVALAFVVCRKRRGSNSAKEA